MINTISENSGHDRMAEYWDPGEISEPFSESFSVIKKDAVSR